MKSTVFITTLLFVATLTFSQQNRFDGLKSKIDDSSAHFHEVLDTANVDFQKAENRVKYEAFNKRYNAITRQLVVESETLKKRSSLANITPEEIKDRRAKIETLVTELDALKSEYDTWLRSVS
jgi:hypothetical protein